MDEWIVVFCNYHEKFARFWGRLSIPICSGHGVNQLILNQNHMHVFYMSMRNYHSLFRHQALAECSQSLKLIHNLLDVYWVSYIYNCLLLDVWWLSYFTGNVWQKNKRYFVVMRLDFRCVFTHLRCIRWEYMQ